MRFSITAVDLFERSLTLRLPFRFGGVTLTRAPQAFVRARIRLENGREAEGAAAQLLVPKWFDKSPQVSDEENLAHLRDSLRLAREAYLAGEANTAFGHSIDHYGPQIAMAAVRGLNSLEACFGPAVLDQAVLDAVCRGLGISFFSAIRKNVAGITAPGWQQDLFAFDMDEYLSSLSPKPEIAARHTVGLLDAITDADVKQPLNDGLPQTLAQVLERYGHRWFKLKISGDQQADIERLCAIASVLDGHFSRLGEPYHATLDGNEQYEDGDAALAFWHAVRSEPRLKALASSIAFIEQPVKRQNLLASDVSGLAEEKAIIIDESDDSLEAFPLARRHGYTGVSSKSCKGLYKSLLNSARCRLWNREEGANRYFMSAEDLTTQAGLAVQQDLALASILGLTHVERNGHHYVNGMAGLPEDEQARFLQAHPDLYERSHGAVRLKIRDGKLGIGSLAATGYASAAMPDWHDMKELRQA